MGKKRTENEREVGGEDNFRAGQALRRKENEEAYRRAGRLLAATLRISLVFYLARFLVGGGKEYYNYTAKESYAVISSRQPR